MDTGNVMIITCKDALKGDVIKHPRYGEVAVKGAGFVSVRTNGTRYLRGDEEVELIRKGGMHAKEALDKWALEVNAASNRYALIALQDELAHAQKGAKLLFSFGSFGGFALAITMVGLYRGIVLPCVVFGSLAAACAFVCWRLWPKGDTNGN